MALRVPWPCGKNKVRAGQNQSGHGPYAAFYGYSHLVKKLQGSGSEILSCPNTVLLGDKGFVGSSRMAASSEHCVVEKVASKCCWMCCIGGA